MSPRTETKMPYLDPTLPLADGFDQRPEDYPMSRHSTLTHGSRAVTRILTNLSKDKPKRARIVLRWRTTSRTRYLNGSKESNERYKTNKGSNRKDSSGKAKMSNRTSRTNKASRNRNTRTKARTTRSLTVLIPPMPRRATTSRIMNGETQKHKMTKPTTMVVGMDGEMMTARGTISTILGRTRTTTIGVTISTMTKEIW